MGNYRPVSNLSFMSKLIERAVASQLNVCQWLTTYYHVTSLLTGKGIRLKRPCSVSGQISWQQQIGGTLHCWDCWTF